MSSETDSPLKITMRWIAFLPAAIIAAFIGHFLMRLFSLLGSSRYGDDSWWSYIWSEFLANGAFGAAFVYAGCYVAPSQKKGVGIALAAVLLFLSGAAFFVNLSMKEWMGIWGLIGLNIGSGWIAYATIQDEIEYD